MATFYKEESTKNFQSFFYIDYMTVKLVLIEKTIELYKKLLTVL